MNYLRSRLNNNWNVINVVTAILLVLNGSIFLNFKIRFSLVFLDIFIPFITFAIYFYDENFKLYYKKIIKSRYAKEFSFTLFLFLFALIFGSFVNFYRWGWVSNWGVINKTFGFAILCNYIILFVYMFRPENRFRMINSIAVVYSFVCLTVFILYFLFGSITNLIDGGHFSGTLVNATATSFFGLIIYLMFNYYSGKTLLSTHYKVFIKVLLISTILCTNSRIGFLCLAILAVYLISTNIDIKTNIITIIFALIIWYIYRNFSSPVFIKMIVLDKDFFSHVGATNISRVIMLNDSSTEIRMSSFLDAINLFFKYPFFGAGLGYFYATYNYLYEGYVVIHNTTLWIAAELGIVGLIIYSLLFIKILSPVFLAYKYDKVLFRFFVMGHIIFILFSLVQEVLYQRIYWIFISLSIASYFEMNESKSNELLK